MTQNCQNGPKMTQNGPKISTSWKQNSTDISAASATFCISVRRSADFILWARHRRGGAGLRGNKIYTLRRQERSPILVAMVVQQMVEREYWRKYPRANMMRPLLSPLSKDIRAQRNVTQVEIQIGFKTQSWYLDKSYDHEQECLKNVQKTEQTLLQ